MKMTIRSTYHRLVNQMKHLCAAHTTSSESEDNVSNFEYKHTLRKRRTNILGSSSYTFSALYNMWEIIKSHKTVYRWFGAYCKFHMYKTTQKYLEVTEVN